MRILILHDVVGADARADELDVLVQRDAVAHALKSLGHDVDALAVGLDLAMAAEEIRARTPDVAFNLVESIVRSGRLIHFAPALCDVLGVRYTGAPSDAMYATSNKLLAKRLLRGAGLPTPSWVEAAQSMEFEPGRFIVKSVWEHGSLGLGDDAVVDVRSEAELRAVLHERAPRLGGDAFAEHFVDGRELNLSLLATQDGVDVLPPAEIEFVDWPKHKPRIVGYGAKWSAGTADYDNTPRRFEFGAEDRPLLEELIALSRAAWRAFGLRGYARVDFRVDAAGRSWILEVNANPCLSPDAGFAAALARARVSFEDAVARIVADV